MLRLDFLNKEYNLDEIINAFTDNNLNNFNGDKDFLNFLMSFSLGNYLEGEEEDNYKEFAMYNGLLKIMRLDEYGYFGKKLYKIYQICNKDKNTFMETCSLIGEYSLYHILEKESIDINLKLKKPVSFIDHSIVLCDGTKPVFNPLDRYNPYNLNRNQKDELNYELERSFRKRINESIKNNGDNIELLEEMPSFEEKERLKKEEEERKRVNDDYFISIQNLYFGYEEYDVSGGILNMCMKMISWFEYINMKIGQYYVFRSIPKGDFFLIDSDGKVFIPDENINVQNQTIGPNTPIREVKIANIPEILNYNLLKNNYDDENSEIKTLEINGLIEYFENKGKIKVGDLELYQSKIRELYENITGNIFSLDDSNNKEGNKK